LGSKIFFVAKDVNVPAYLKWMTAPGSKCSMQICPQITAALVPSRETIGIISSIAFARNSV